MQPRTLTLTAEGYQTLLDGNSQVAANRYPTAAVKTAVQNSIKALALAGGVNLSSWEG